MSVNHIFIQTCYLVVLLNFTHTYVLFAANLDDFRSIAKKFIPDKLADQLTDMASQNSMKYRQQINKEKQINIDKVIDEINKQVHVDKEKDDYKKENIEEEIEYSEETADREVVKKHNRQDEKTQKKRFAIKDQEKSIDFEELVDRVRQQLEGSKKKQENYNYYNKDQNADSEENNYESDQIEKSKHEDTTKATHDTQYYDDVTEPAAPENDGMLFKEADLTKINDSYEDYVTPERDNVFESDTETRTSKVQHLQTKKESRYKDQRLKAVTEREKPAKNIKALPLAEDDQAPFVDDRYDDEEIKKSEEVKAQTERIVDDPDQKGKPKKLKGTMIPTREYFKMSSPNYFGKLPAVAEKYDFNEPLPEKDREPENLKHFANPPASINKKVKLTSN